MSKPLILTSSTLEQHLLSVGEALSAILEDGGVLTIDADWNLDPLVAGLVGHKCEVAPRNRGSSASVAPCVLLDGSLWAWLGYREEWAHEEPAGATKRFSFRSASITMHFGYPSNLFKPQVFRAEWSGWAKWAGDSYGFQATDAGHPHWQFDALESLRSNTNASTAEEYLAILKEEAADFEPKEFVPNGLSDNEVGEIVANTEFSKIHFSSAAMWWKLPPGDSHAHVPASAIEINKWVKATTRYLMQEIRRL